MPADKNYIQGVKVHEDLNGIWQQSFRLVGTPTGRAKMLIQRAI
jgi:hypothetical protein